jgi:hypothetical protein
VLVEMLTASIADEYRTYYTYERVLADLGDPKPFSNIADAEAQHIAAVAKLFENRGLPVPDSQYALDTVPGFTTLTAACVAGVEAETAGYQMYEAFLVTLGSEPQDVVNVFTSLMLASRDKHLPAFTTCAK